MAIIAVALFVAGSIVLPRGTSVTESGSSFYVEGQGATRRISVAEAHYLSAARGFLSPGGGALALLALSAGVLVGIANSTDIGGTRRKNTADQR
jgi:hypothetical protein